MWWVGMSKVLFDDVADVTDLQERFIAVVGGGPMGHAQALCLRDSGAKVLLGLADGDPYAEHARNLGFTVVDVPTACEESDTIVLLEADQLHRETYSSIIAPNVVAGDLLIFGSGFNVAFGFITPDPLLDVAMVAPQGTAKQVREEFTNGRGVAVAVAVHQDASGHAEKLTYAYAKALGGFRAGGVKTTVHQYTSAEVFGSYAVADGVLAACLESALAVLSTEGVPDVLAYFAVVHSAKSAVDAWAQRGIAQTRSGHSDWARYTAEASGRHIVDAATRQQLQSVYQHIESGVLARQFLADVAAGSPLLARYEAAAAASGVDRSVSNARAQLGLKTVDLTTDTASVW